MSEPEDRQPVLSVVFFKLPSGREPVREWLLSLSREDRRTIGFNVKTAQYGWPLGMLVKKSQKTPAPELKTAQQRLADLRKE